MASPNKPVADTGDPMDTDTQETAKGKIDPITALQDDIDGLSLAMFEALRGLRDAVAPESGNLGGASSDTAEPDLDELWAAYRSGDAAIVAQMTGDGARVTKREDFVRLHAKMEMEKDTELVMKLAAVVLAKSAEIDRHVDTLPGMQRTREEQMKRIQELIVANRESAEQLEAAYADARTKRDQCRDFIRHHTCQALGIEGDEQES